MRMIASAAVSSKASGQKLAQELQDSGLSISLADCPEFALGWRETPFMEMTESEVIIWFDEMESLVLLDSRVEM